MEVIDMGDFSLSDAKQAQQVKQPTPMPKMPNITLPKQIPMAKPKPTEEDIKQHQEHVLMLSRYGTSPRFGEYLKGLTFNLDMTHLRKMNLQELNETLERVRTSIANKTVSDVWSESVLGAMNVGETVVNMSVLSEYIRINGLCEALQEDDSFLDLLEELKLENQNLAYVSPYVRIAYVILSVGAKVHGMNSLMVKRQARVEAKQGQEAAKVITTKQDNTDAKPKPTRDKNGEKIIDMSD